MPTSLFQWSWIATGFISKEKMAAMNGMATKEIEANCTEAKKLSTTGYDFDDNGEIDDFEPESINNILDTPQPGEVTFAWQVEGKDRPCARAI